jgi:hypothetical protein
VDISLYLSDIKHLPVKNSNLLSYTNTILLKFCRFSTYIWSLYPSDHFLWKFDTFYLCLFKILIFNDGPLAWMTTICMYVFIAVSTWLLQFDKLMLLFLQMTSFMWKLICWYPVDVGETHVGNMFLALIGVDNCKAIH